jgi:hypothetical protein
VRSPFSKAIASRLNAFIPCLQRSVY